jgi:uncharacterized protein (DUF1499 family)
VKLRDLAVAIAASLLVACAGAPPTDLGVRGSRLAPCPASPNCVASDAREPDHAIAALPLAGPASEAWHAVRAAVAALPRTRIVTATDHYLHAECSSALFRFVDDLELQLLPEEGIIAVRSASRVGYGDMGVNRRRVEDLREALASAGVHE